MQGDIECVWVHIQSWYVVMCVGYKYINKYMNVRGCIYSPGDTGFKVFRSMYANIGVAICWDQVRTSLCTCVAVSI